MNETFWSTQYVHNSKLGQVCQIWIEGPHIAPLLLNRLSHNGTKWFSMLYKHEYINTFYKKGKLLDGATFLIVSYDKNVLKPHSKPCYWIQDRCLCLGSKSVLTVLKTLYLTSFQWRFPNNKIYMFDRFILKWLVNNELGFV